MWHDMCGSKMVPATRMVLSSFPFRQKAGFMAGSVHNIQESRQFVVVFHR
jgi:hypothetical protein